MVPRGFAWLVRLGCVAVAATLVLNQRGVGQSLSPKDFEGIKSLKDAIEVVKERLKHDGEAEYADLLSETKVREAVRTAVRSYEALLEKEEKRHPGSKEYFEKEVKPVCQKIASTREWPPDCSFFSFYSLGGGNGIVYDRLGLRLRIETPKAKFQAFALPVVDLYLGRFEEPGE